MMELWRLSDAETAATVAADFHRKSHLVWTTIDTAGYYGTPCGLRTKFWCDECFYGNWVEQDPEWIGEPTTGKPENVTCLKCRRSHAFKLWIVSRETKAEPKLIEGKVVEDGGEGEV